MPAYCIRYKSDGVETGIERFFDQDSFQAILLAQEHALAQSHSESAELWTDGKYIITMCLVDGGEFWRLYREPDVVARNDAFNARPVVALPFFNSPESRRRKLASHRPTNGKARSLAATTDS